MTNFERLCWRPVREGRAVGHLDDHSPLAHAPAGLEVGNRRHFAPIAESAPQQPTPPVARCRRPAAAAPAAKRSTVSLFRLPRRHRANGRTADAHLARSRSRLLVGDEAERRRSSLVVACDSGCTAHLTTARVKVTAGFAQRRRILLFFFLFCRSDKRARPRAVSSRIRQTHARTVPRAISDPQPLRLKILTHRTPIQLSGLAETCAGSRRSSFGSLDDMENGPRLFLLSDPGPGGGERIIARSEPRPAGDVRRSTEVPIVGSNYVSEKRYDSRRETVLQVFNVAEAFYHTHVGRVGTGACPVAVAWGPAPMIRYY